MSIGIFTDKNQQPGETEIIEALGDSFSLWEWLIAFIRETFPCQESFQFLYGKNYGWAWRFRIKGKMLANLYPARDAFVAQVNLNPQAVEKAQGMNLGQNARQSIDGAFPYPEGRWAFIRVESERDLEDAKQLITLRAETKKLTEK